MTYNIFWGGAFMLYTIMLGLGSPIKFMKKHPYLQKLLILINISVTLCYMVAIYLRINHNILTQNTAVACFFLSLMIVDWIAVGQITYTINKKDLKPFKDTPELIQGEFIYIQVNQQDHSLENIQKATLIRLLFITKLNVIVSQADNIMEHAMLVNTNNKTFDKLLDEYYNMSDLAKVHITKKQIKAAFAKQSQSDEFQELLAQLQTSNHLIDMSDTAISSNSIAGATNLVKQNNYQAKTASFGYSVDVLTALIYASFQITNHEESSQLKSLRKNF